MLGDIDKNLQAKAVSDLNEPHLVYDLTIEDLTERQRKAKLFENVKAVAKFLGVTEKKVVNNRMFPKKIRAYNGNYYSVRKAN
jgi:hypothetical protein